VQPHVPWAYGIGFAASIVFSLWVPVRMLPWWLAVILGGVVLVLAAIVWQTAAGSSMRKHAAVVMGFVATGLLLNSIWPIVLLIPTVQAVRKWPEVRETGSREGP